MRAVSAGPSRTRLVAQGHQELRGKGMTLELLWGEYRALRMPHQPGQHCYVDYAGPTVPIHDPSTGEVQRAQVFVDVLGYSQYVFADLHPQQTTAWWVRGHVDAFAYFEGVPRIVVPDNAKAVVTQAERFDVTLLM